MQLLRPERDGQRLGHRVGVHVEDLAILVARQARDDRDEARLHEGDEDPGVHPVDVADVAVVHHHGPARRRPPPAPAAAGGR